MSRHVEVVAAVLAAAAAACTPPAAEPDGHAPLHAALSGAARAQGCAEELARAAEEDPAATAALLRVEPAALAPWGGAGRGQAAVREVILARAASAQEAARAARSLALLGEHASPQQEALRRERIAASLAASSALCAAAAEVRGGLLAQRPAHREPP